VINKHTPSWPVDGSSSADERNTKLRAFAAGHIKVICAPRILDEGIDVPEAEVAVIVSASQSRRQMIQRMGRVIRKKKDGRAARIVIFFFHDSPEDPSLGGHESFLDEIRPHAQTVTTYGPDIVDQIEGWLAND
jgi:RNA polymerase primary sigma factor